MLLNFLDGIRVRLRGIPPVPGDTPVEIARAVLRRNARRVLHSGAGHFKFLWVVDLAWALRGAEHALPREYLRNQIGHVLRESGRLGRVPTCLRPARGFDMPYPRADGLPWLIHAVDEYARFAGDRRLLDGARPGLARLVAAWEREHLGEDGLVRRSVAGDWMDTVLRPSSTYNNVCALMMAEKCRAIEVESALDPERLSARILESRFRAGAASDGEGRLTDHDGTEATGVDGAVVALYLGLFPRAVREALAAHLEASDLVRPLPIRISTGPYDRRLLPLISRLTPGYHASTWLHMGLLYLNGLKRLGRDISAHRARVDDLVLRHRNFLECLDGRGEPYRTAFHATEYGLSMAAGQYLELALS